MDFFTFENTIFLILAFQQIVYGFLLILLKSVAFFFHNPYIALKFQYPSKTQTRFFFASANYVWWTGCWVAQSSGLGAQRNYFIAQLNRFVLGYIYLYEGTT